MFPICFSTENSFLCMSGKREYMSHFYVMHAHFHDELCNTCNVGDAVQGGLLLCLREHFTPTICLGVLNLLHLCIP